MAAANAVALYFLLPESLSSEHRVKAGERASIAQVFEGGGNWPLKAILSLTDFFAMLSPPGRSVRAPKKNPPRKKR